MLLAGELEIHGIRGFEFFLPVGVQPTREERALSLAHLMRPGRVMTGPTARWIHVGGPTPQVVELSRRSGRTLLVDHPLRARFKRLRDREVIACAGVVVTTVARTMADLRGDGLHDEAALLKPLLESGAQPAGKAG